VDVGVEVCGGVLFAAEGEAMSGMDRNACRIELEGRGAEVLDFLQLDLRDMRRELEAHGTCGVSRAEAIERNLLYLLESLSPALKAARAQYERYRAAPKVGG
jgi:hypothetical protein